VTPDSLKPPEIIIVNKEVAARGQLHMAIAIWFEYGDPVSIHTLAAAAQGILEGLVGSKHKLTHMRQWLTKLRPHVQRIVRDPQNYFKHSWRDTKAEKAAKPYQPYIGDIIIADACLLHQDLFGLTPGIRAFTIRLSFERPPILAPRELSAKITQGIHIADLEGLSRPAFLRTVLSRLPPV